MVESGFENFNIILNTITVNYNSTLSHFDNRSTNASAESFNAKIKAFSNLPITVGIEVLEKLISFSLD
ncbi:transposase [Flavobacterium sp. PL002]|uniref:transposase n=1 Tax=Flavobacterium sp. PL002 TaxID=1897058 RepID=UPI00351C605D